MKGRADLLETIECTDNKRIFHKPNAQHLTTKGLQASFVVSCTYCKKPHFIYNCPEFINLTVKEKCENVKKLKLCNNCLKTGHYSSKCNFGPCRKCSAKHNTLLHAESMETETKTDQVASTSLSATNIESGQVLLSTALIKIHDHSGRTHIINALLDSGSQSSFLTLDLCNKLKLRKEKTDISVSGLNNAISVLQFKCGVTIESCINAYKTNLSCYVINEITNNVPGKKIDISNLAIPLNIKLANPTFYKPKKIDILIGADLFWNLICIGQIRLGPYLPTLQKTRFGWIVSGPVGNQVPNQVSCHVSKLYDLEKQLARFWEIEECPHTKLFSAEETACETYFKDTLQRANDGRFIVKIPLKDSVERMGESKALAIKRFGRLENKFKTNEVLKTSYIEVMNEYQIMGHMTNVTDQVQPPFTYYMPHHAVIREDAKTTKLRVVFDASAPTSTGISFNQIQMVGPTMQDNII